MTGPTGPAGPPGLPGTDAGVVVARAKSTRAVTTDHWPDFTEVPVTGNTWTQDATESNFFYGSITYTHPGTCTEVAGVRVRASIAPDNAASLRVAAKAGFTGVRGSTEDGELVLVRAGR